MAYAYRFTALLVLLSTTVRFSSALTVELPIGGKNSSSDVSTRLSVKKDITLDLLWYGKFTPTQRSIIVDFVRSINYTDATAKGPSVASWWKTRDKSTIVLGKQLLLEDYPLGKSLKNPHLKAMSNKLNGGGGVRSVTAVFTAKDVKVEGFCMNRCGAHGSKSSSLDGGAYVWVGNSEKQCPEYCARPFHQQLNGLRSPPLIAPNGDVGVDGLIIIFATLLVEAVNGDQEPASYCVDRFGSGAYPGYADHVLVDKTTGASYNALGIAGRKYLLPAIWDPQTSTCNTLV